MLLADECIEKICPVLHSLYTLHGLALSRVAMSKTVFTTSVVTKLNGRFDS